MKLYTPCYKNNVEAAGHSDFDLTELGGEFGLWQLPWVYTSEEEEYRMVRERVGFCDTSFIIVHSILGRDAVKFCQKTFVNDMSKISPGKILYAPVVNEAGQVIRECSLFWLEENHVLFITGADLGEWLEQHAGGMDVHVVRRPYCMLALQGPKSREVLQKAVDVKDLPRFGLMQDKINDIPTLIARFGCSGELGYELYVRPEFGPDFWDTLIELGKDYGCGPYGIAEQWCTYIEKGFLTDDEYSVEGGFGRYEGATPLEIGLEWTIAWNKKEDFLGKEALIRRKQEGLKTKLMGFELADPNAEAAPGDKLVMGGRTVGEVLVYAIPSPFVGAKIGKAWVKIEDAKEGAEVEIEHEKARVAAKLVRGRWYDPENKRLDA